MFAYCENNPPCASDPLGFWTIGFSVGANVTLFVGASISIGFFIDGHGNHEIQWNYSVQGVNDTKYGGVADAGIGGSLQFTDRDTVNVLHGPAWNAGFSGGPGWYVGGDVITFDENPWSAESKINGFQITGGVGVGIDTHIVKSISNPLNPNGKKNSVGKTSIKPHTNSTNNYIKKNNLKEKYFF